ncbi:MAG TPA: hypothetical protein VEY71_11490 [Chitinophagales bacterium]|nr:hypothetical protein [Chitinophagales bacterium]
MKTSTHRRFVFTVLFTAFVSVATLERAAAQPTISNTATFLFFSVEAADPKPVVTLNETRVVSGEFKMPAVQDGHGHDGGMLVVRVEDRAGKTAYETHLFNPLDQNLEYVNHDGQLDRARVQQTSGDFEVRVPFDLAGHTVHVYVVDAHNRLNLLFTK